MTDGEREILSELNADAADNSDWRDDCDCAACLEQNDGNLCPACWVEHEQWWAEYVREMSENFAPQAARTDEDDIPF